MRRPAVAAKNDAREWCTQSPTHLALRPTVLCERLTEAVVSPISRSRVRSNLSTVQTARCASGESALPISAICCKADEWLGRFNKSDTRADCTAPELLRRFVASILNIIAVRSRDADAKSSGPPGPDSMELKQSASTSPECFTGTGSRALRL